MEVNNEHNCTWPLRKKKHVYLCQNRYSVNLRLKKVLGHRSSGGQHVTNLGFRLWEAGQFAHQSVDVTLVGSLTAYWRKKSLIFYTTSICGPLVRWSTNPKIKASFHERTLKHFSSQGKQKQNKKSGQNANNSLWTAMDKVLRVKGNFDETRTRQQRLCESHFCSWQFTNPLIWCGYLWQRFCSWPMVECVRVIAFKRETPSWSSYLIPLSQWYPNPSGMAAYVVPCMQF